MMQRILLGTKPEERMIILLHTEKNKEQGQKWKQRSKLSLDSIIIYTHRL